ncbi:hypothetical protein [Tychonema sp. LEGE 07203]|uniref:hypothetical protein n=1 Tax=Tychonema sp. LEGE 07203 TaxID=1828671 RepID=UPI001881FB96|nr:hypothetical protein [Tychonema sp. LEGE 07203]MBE9096474.1 hypothetical protein [Tychonema sp. LEGE 07203]
MAFKFYVKNNLHNEWAVALSITLNMQYLFARQLNSFACEDFIGYILGYIVEWVLVVFLKHKIRQKYQKS